MSPKELIILGCSSQQPTRTRNQGAYLFRWNGEGLLFDPGEGTQRQFIFANVSPTTVTRIFISHFHGDHCLGLGSMLMRLNLDRVTYPIHCYYPKSGKKYFDALRFSTIHHQNIQVIEHPVSQNGVVENFGSFCIEAAFLEHGVDNLGWRITEPDKIKFYKEKLLDKRLYGENIQTLLKNKKISYNGEMIFLKDVSYVKEGDSIAIISDTLPCNNALTLAKNSRLLLCESTYLESHKELARKHFHLTAKQAASIAKEANAKKLILTHFSARYSNIEEFETEAREVFPNTYAAEDFKVFSFSNNN